MQNTVRIRKNPNHGPDTGFGPGLPIRMQDSAKSCNKYNVIYYHGGPYCKSIFPRGLRSGPSPIAEAKGKYIFPVRTDLNGY